MVPAASPRCHALVEHACAALRRLSTAPTHADAARALLEEVELYWAHTPLTVAILGDDLALRSALLDVLAGEALFDPSRRQPAGMVLTVRRGVATGYRARRRDGSVEELTLYDLAPPTPATPAAGPVVPAAPVAAALAEPIVASPPPASAMAPAPWWRRLWWWLAGVLGRRSTRPALTAPLAALPAGAGVAPGPLAAAPLVAPPVRPITSKLPALPKTPVTPLALRRQFIADVRALTDEAANGAGVERVFVELADGPLPAGVVVVDVPVDGLERLAEADGCVLVWGPGRAVDATVRALVQAAHATLPHVYVATAQPAAPQGLPSGGPLRVLGCFADVPPVLPALLATERALRLSRRAHAMLRRGLVALDDVETAAETGFRARIDRLEDLRLGDPVALTTSRLERLRPQVIERVHLLIEQATDDVTARLGQLAAGWAELIAGATSPETLRAAVTRIDEESAPALAASRAATQRLVEVGLARAAHDLHVGLTAQLHPPTGQGDVGGPAPGAVVISPSLATPRARVSLTAAPRLTSLFRSVEALRANVLEALAARLAALRNVAVAELLDAEPRLSATLTEALAAGLAAALARHTAWLDETLVSERLAVASERAALQPLVRARDDARDDDARLTELLALAEAELPGRA